MNGDEIKMQEEGNEVVANKLNKSKATKNNSNNEGLFNRKEKKQNQNN